MKCDAFEERLQDLLDARASLDADPQLAAHARQCPACRETLALYEALDDGLESRSQPEPSPQLVDGVFDRLTTGPRPTRKLWPLVVPIGLAAALLIAVRPLVFNAEQPAAAPQPPQNVWTDSPAPDALPMELIAGDPSQEQYLSMIRLTGQAMATLPDTVRRVAAPADDSPVAPLTSSFSAALDALRSTLPSKPTPASGESQS